MAIISSLFKNLTLATPRPFLRDRILAAVALAGEQRTAAHRRFSLVGMILSGALLLFGGMEYGESLLQSDFWTLMTLLFSDMDFVVRSFGEFGYSLLETLPLLPLLVLFAPLTIFFWSLSLLLALPERNTKMFPSVFAH